MEKVSLIKDCGSCDVRMSNIGTYFPRKPKEDKQSPPNYNNNKQTDLLYRQLRHKSMNGGKEEFHIDPVPVPDARLKRKQVFHGLTPNIQFLLEF